MKAKRMIASFLIFPIIMLSGCWDKIEIEQRAIIGALVFDKVGVEGSDKASIGKDIIEVNFLLVNPSKLQSSDEAFVSKKVKGMSLPDASEKLSSKISRMPFFGHTRLLVFTEKFMKDDKLFRETLDDLERRAVINQQMKVVVLKNKPDKLKDVKPKLENLVAAYITGIEENARISSEIVSMSLADLVRDIRDGEGSAAIPALKIGFNNGGEFIIDELTLIKDYKFLRYLDRKYVGSYKLITKKLERAREFFEFNDIVIPYNIYTVDRKMWMSDKENLKYKIRYEIEGDVSQYEFNKNLFDTKLISSIEKKIATDMKKDLKDTTDYFQKEIGHDYLGFDSYTHKYYNKVYKKYKDNWDEAFKKMNIDYEVKINVRRIGTTKK